MGTIVVGVDESTKAADALRWAVAEARFRDWTVTAVLCWGYLDQHHASGTDFDPEYDAGDAKDALDAIVEAVVGGQAAATIDRRLVNDLPAHGLLQSAAGADLLVLGARGVGALDELTLGSVSQQCLHHSSIPVVVVRGPQTTAQHGQDRIVVGVDGSDDSRRALAWAVDEAKVRGAAVIAVTAWSPPSVASRYLVAGPTDTQAYEHAAGEILDATVDAVCGRDGAPPVERVVVRGDARSVLVERASDADLMVVGSRGRGGFKELLLGSVSHHLAHHVRCPLVVLPRTR
jgi:nucleotide-binding universal stress UspA family protein